MSAGLVRSNICAASLEFSRSGALSLSPYNEERVESEAEIGSSEFRAGEFTCGFIEQLPKAKIGDTSLIWPNTN